MAPGRTCPGSRTPSVARTSAATTSRTALSTFARRGTVVAPTSTGRTGSTTTPSTARSWPGPIPPTATSQATRTTATTVHKLPEHHAHHLDHPGLDRQCCGRRYRPRQGRHVPRGRPLTCPARAPVGAGKATRRRLGAADWSDLPGARPSAPANVTIDGFTIKGVDGIADRLLSCRRAGHRRGQEQRHPGRCDRCSRQRRRWLRQS